MTTTSPADEAAIADVASINGQLLPGFRPALVIVAVLVVSGLAHLSLLWITGADWEGPLSLRKPGLFGVSAGVTVWSMAWVLTQLQPRRYDYGLCTAMSVGILVEVGLITLQHWRGVPSHFNRATPVDLTIELIMLALILLVTASIALLCLRSSDLRSMPEARAIAIRGGLWLLLISCGLGLVVTIAGEVNVAFGRSPETWGQAGVLKYPHGAALHAIQALPLLALLLERLRISNAGRLVYCALAAQVLFLGHALWQTLRGRARLDLDPASLVLLVAAGLLLVPVLAALARRVAVIARDL